MSGRARTLAGGALAGWLAGAPKTACFCGATGATTTGLADSNCAGVTLTAILETGWAVPIDSFGTTSTAPGTVRFT